MKKTIITLLATLTLILALGAVASADFGWEPLESFNHRLVINNVDDEKLAAPQYMMHNSVIYIPLDEYHLTLLGATLTREGSALTLSPAPNENFSAVTDKAMASPADSVRELGGKVILNGIEFVNNEQSYRFMESGGQVYMPLAWEYVTAMNWLIYTDNTATTVSRLYSNNKFMVRYQNPENLWVSYRHYYALSNTYCAKLEYNYTRHFSSQKLLLGQWNDLKDFSNTFFRNGFRSEGMSLKNNVLTISANYYNQYQSYSNIPTPANYANESYILTIDVATGELTDTLYLDRTVYDSAYGLKLNSDGSFADMLNLSGIMGEYYNDYGYMDGSHVILNGNMMPSYSMFIYVGRGDNGNGGPTSVAGSPRSYWIMAENLENYGYDMVVDHENRATYFTYNPEKTITPMSLEGTNVHLPALESDWKIYIDGKEPLLYFNIGGYTLIYSGELGEAVEDKLPDGYDVLRVTSSALVQPKVKSYGVYGIDDLAAAGLTDFIYPEITVSQNTALNVSGADHLTAYTTEAHNKNIRMIASVADSTYYTDIAADSELCRRFINNCVWLVRNYSLDGIEIAMDKTHPVYAQFMAELRKDPRMAEILIER